MMQTRSSLIAVSLLAAVVLCSLSRDRAEAAGGAEKPLLREHLGNVPGSDLTAIVVNYGPGGKSAEHHHAGSVFAYVVSGSIRSQNSMTGPERVYRAGEAFFEPAGSAHLVSENASDTEPASLLAVFVAPANVALTLPGR